MLPVYSAAAKLGVLDQRGASAVVADGLDAGTPQLELSGYEAAGSTRE